MLKEIQEYIVVPYLTGCDVYERASFQNLAIQNHYTRQISVVRIRMICWRTVFSE